MEQYFSIFQEQYNILLKERLSTERWRKLNRQFSEMINKRWGYEALKDISPNIGLHKDILKHAEEMRNI